MELYWILERPILFEFSAHNPNRQGTKGNDQGQEIIIMNVPVPRDILTKGGPMDNWYQRVKKFEVVPQHAM